MGKKLSIYQQVFLNLLPVLGYWFWHWSMFAIVYIYWVEAVILSVFVALKVMVARGPEPNGTIVSTGRRIVSGLKILLFRLGIMLFYWIFIFAFVAMGQGKESTQAAIDNVSIIVFMNQGFNLAVLAFFLSQIIEFIGAFILNDVYKTTPSSAYKQLFDSRTIIIHVVVVLGTFACQFLQKYIDFDNRLPGLGFVLVLFFAKSLADVVLYHMRGKADPLLVSNLVLKEK